MFKKSRQELRVGRIPEGYASHESDGVDFEPIYVWSHTDEGAKLVSRFAIDAALSTAEQEVPGETSQAS